MHTASEDPASTRVYLDLLTNDDLALVVRLTDGGSGKAAERASYLRARPDLLVQRLARPELFEALFGNREHPQRAPLVGASPFLAFTVAVHRASADLSQVTYVDEWVGVRQRIPVFGVVELRAFVEDPLRRLFLAELLASYTHVASGTVWVRTTRGLKRRRWNELDPVRLVGLLEAVPDHAQAAVYRRLGDAALFLTGVFPDHTAGRRFRPLEVERLVRAVERAGTGRGVSDELAEALAVRGGVGLLEELGARWYRLAATRAGPPLPASLAAVEALAERFGQARRVLNYLTDRYLFPFREEWFPAAGA